jgi:predicted dinucleotide-binding enzyme
MKIAIVGAGHMGMALALLCVSKAKAIGIEAEAREATPAEEKYCKPIKPVVIEPLVCPETVTAFEQPRFNGYMGHRPKPAYQLPKVKKWK